MVKKQGKRTVAPVPQEDPEWLLSDPEGTAPDPPAQSRASTLPVGAMEWRNFERLCRKLADCGGEVESAQAYVTPVLAFAAASMLYVAVADLIPTLHRRFSIKDTFQQMLMIGLGVATVVLTNSLLHAGHGH